ncbi:MAG: CvpA family protein [Prevotellaceae bacterium]|jgi:membrane protein required for colicin V production|nr:CvpA family protein [Prevotellaceae bacterium]
MNGFDIVFALLLGYAAYQGFRQGVIKQVVALLALLLGAYAAFRFSGEVGKWMAKLDIGAYAISIIAFTLTFAVVVLLANLLGSLLKKAVHVAMLGWLDRLLGMVLSVAKMAIIISVALLILAQVDKAMSLLPQETVRRSKLYAPAAAIAPALLPYLDFDKLGQTLDDIERRVEKSIKHL